MGSWNKETQIVSMYFGEYFAHYAPFTMTSMRNMVEESILNEQEGVVRELLLTSLSNVDWYDLVETYNSEAEEEVLIDEF